MRSLGKGIAVLAMVAAASMANAAGVTLGTGAIAVQGSCGSEVTVPVTVTAVTGMDAFGVDVTFNTSVLTYVRTEAGSATADWGIIGGNAVSAGVLRLGGAKFNGTALTGNGEVLRVVFNCSGTCGNSSNLTASNLVDDLAGATITNGSVSCNASGTGPVVKIKEYTFDANAEGWTFISTPGFTAPISDVATPGYLLIAANGDNSGTFGSLISPAVGFTMETFDPLADGTQTGALFERQGPHYVVRFHIRRTTADRTKAPIARLRVNSSNFEDYHLLTLNSVPTFDRVPRIFTSQAVDLFFQPHPLMYTLAAGSRTYRIAVDILNVDGADDANGGTIVDKVEVFAVPLTKLSTIANVKQYSWASSAEFSDWDQFNFAPTFEPVTFTTAVASGLQMSYSNPSPDPTPLATAGFGFWQSKAGVITPNATGQTGALFVKLKYLVRANEASGRKVPQMRFRAAPTNFTSVSETGVLDASSFTFVPRSGNDRIFYTYLQVPTGSTTFPIFATWDLLAFESFADTTDQTTNETSSQNVILRNLAVDLIQVTDYPAVQ